MNAVIRSTGLWVPEDTVSNEELVECYNKHVELYNAEHADAIKRGAVEAKNPSSVGFIEKASGIKSRYSIDKAGVLDVDRMRPRVAPRPNEEISIMAECGVAAARQALSNAGRDAADVDAVICSGTSMQRTYPCIAIEIQDALGIEGFGFDMTVACSSGTFAIINAVNMIKSGMAKSVLVVCPELTTAQLNFRDRDSHFIFGDVAVAMLIESEDMANGDGWRILGTRMMTKFSNNIRSNFGFLNACEVPEPEFEDRYFVQEGRKVYKEVCPMVAEMILEDLATIDLTPADLKRLWLHQANINMNMMVARKVLGRDAELEEAPVILDEFANTAGAGSLVAFHRHHDGFAAGEKGLICSFGAGYSAGTVFVERL
ncbi:beta-ketoacyl-ACP synthase III [Maricaulis salignorans]|uniref:Beta-ketodecanoyl-[acyl-carrier-protein] synthase n=1 Tax=Maricaulis salignorans TaxID=144026 RepID=A0A1G9MP42_9PROT|nr:beta-ketoacyl-ACP synthase III [Maricaulis salignorans]SDL75677.1 beta-ketodecanoyl-[acyl-carrier-protein] synthase [Maricaulis salignorans]